MTNNDISTDIIPIAIIGAGIGGLSAAVGLRHHGLNPVVFEQAKKLGEVGGPLGTTPTTLRIFEKWGVLKTYNDISSPVRFFEYRNQDGHIDKINDHSLISAEEAENGKLGYSDPDMSPRTVHRADLHQMLVSYVDPDRVNLDHKLASIKELEDCVELKFVNGSIVRAGLVIAADGIHSTVRKLFSKDEKHYCGSIIFRAVCPAEILEGFGENDRLRSWHAADYSKHIILMPVRAGRQVSIDATLGIEEPPAQLWSAQAKLEELAKQFDDFDPIVPKIIRSAVNNVYMHPVYDRDPIAVWTSARIALVGDAAHPMTPMGGQGANQAIQDGAEIADQISEAAPGEIASALRRYQEIRTVQTAEIQQASRANAAKRAKISLDLDSILLKS